MADLHQEFVRDAQASRDPLTAFDPALHAPKDFDVVVLAGDVDSPLTKSLGWIASRFAGVPVIYTPGNHDFYTGEGAPFTMQEMLEQGAEEADRLGIKLLLDSTTEIGGIRFVGGTLWTDFALGPGSIGAHVSEAQGRFGMNDYRRIRRFSTLHPGKRRRLRPQDTIAAHQATRKFIESELAKPFGRATVVVTHHAPHAKSLDPKHTALPWCYASNLTSILGSDVAPNAWLHGHIHRAAGYTVGRTKVVSNPRGYRFLQTEQNNGFDPGFVVEVGP
jgi:hypothetical protein